MKRTFEISFEREGGPVPFSADHILTCLRNCLETDIKGIGLMVVPQPPEPEPDLKGRFYGCHGCYKLVQYGEVCPDCHPAVVKEMEDVAKRQIARMLGRVAQEPVNPDTSPVDALRTVFLEESDRLKAKLEAPPNPDCPGPCPYHNPLAWAEAQKGKADE